MWLVGEVTESQLRLSKWHCSLLDPSPTDSGHGLPCSGEYLRLHPLESLTGTPRQRSMAQMKEQIKAPKIELSNEEIANLSDAQFKTLVIRTLTEIIE